MVRASILTNGVSVLGLGLILGYGLLYSDIALAGFAVPYLVQWVLETFALSSCPLRKVTVWLMRCRGKKENKIRIRLIKAPLPQHPSSITA